MSPRHAHACADQLLDLPDASAWLREADSIETWTAPGSISLPRFLTVLLSRRPWWLRMLLTFRSVFARALGLQNAHQGRPRVRRGRPGAGPRHDRPRAGRGRIGAVSRHDRPRRGNLGAVSRDDRPHRGGAAAIVPAWTDQALMTPGAQIWIFRVLEAEENRSWVGEARTADLSSLLAAVREPSGRILVISAVHFHTKRGRTFFKLVNPVRRLAVARLVRSSAAAGRA